MCNSNISATTLIIKFKLSGYDVEDLKEAKIWYVHTTTIAATSEANGVKVNFLGTKLPLLLLLRMVRLLLLLRLSLMR